jgi:hypothetical protein
MFPHALNAYAPHVLARGQCCTLCGVVCCRRCAQFGQALGWVLLYVVQMRVHCRLGAAVGNTHPCGLHTMSAMQTKLDASFATHLVSTVSHVGVDAYANNVSYLFAAFPLNRRHPDDRLDSCL